MNDAIQTSLMLRAAFKLALQKVVGLMAWVLSLMGQPTQGDCHFIMTADQGRLAWQATTGYARRFLAETTLGRYKALVGPRLRARGFAA